MFDFTSNFLYNVSMLTSVHNEKIKYYKQLSKQKDILCLDSPKLISEAILNGWEVVAVLKCVDTIFTDSDILVSDNVLKTFTNVKTSQGVVALVKLKHYELRPPDGNFLILDNVQDPGNVGTLIRSAVGANFLDIYLINCASISLEKTVRSTMGALFRCRFYEVDESFVDILKSWNKQILIADMDGEDIYNANFSANVGLVIGNEGHGISKRLIELPHKTISLPMQNGLESLNAGVSGSIIMYQLTYGGKNVRS